MFHFLLVLIYLFVFSVFQEFTMVTLHHRFDDQTGHTEKKLLYEHGEQIKLTPCIIDKSGFCYSFRI